MPTPPFSMGEAAIDSMLCGFLDSIVGFIVGTLVGALVDAIAGANVGAVVGIVVGAIVGAVVGAIVVANAEKLVDFSSAQFCSITKIMESTTAFF